jgi:autotransporter-associated beta strand protein
MKKAIQKIASPLFAFLVSIALLYPHDALAVDFIKANNLTALNVDGSYTTAGVPGTGDKIIVNSTYTTSGALSFGGVSVNALDISTTVTLGSGAWSGTLNLGSGGLTMANTALFRFGGTVVPTANQIWNFNNSGEFRWTGGVTTNSNTITIQGAGSGALNLQGNTTLGSNVIIDKTVSINNGGSYTFGGANTFDIVNIGNSGASGRLRGATLGDFGVASNFGDGGTSSNIVLGSTSTSIGTLEYTGNTASSNRTFLRGATSTANLLNGVIEVSTVGQTLTLSGNLGSPSTATSSGWSLGGNGNLTVTSDILDNANATGVTLLDKFGNGTLTLTGTNSYQGATTVTAGTLLVNGSLANTSSVTVSAGATLGGSGTIAGDTTVNGTLSAGNSPGLLTFNDAGAGVADLTLAGTANSLFEINGNVRGTSYDAVNVEGLLTLGGTLTLDFGYTPLISDTFDLFNFTSQAGSFSSVVFVDSGYAGTFDASTGILSLSAIPEPSTYALLMGGLGLLAFLRRRSKS